MKSVWNENLSNKSLYASINPFIASIPPPLFLSTRRLLPTSFLASWDESPARADNPGHYKALIDALMANTLTYYLLSLIYELYCRLSLPVA
jgi:hypothetical protein